MTDAVSPAVDADEAFRGLSRDQQVRLLVRLAHDLTIVARGYYVPGSDQLADPVAVRMINEVQHRVAAHALNCLDGRDGDAPVGYGFVADCWDHNGLRAGVRWAFDRAYAAVSAVNGVHV